MKHDFNDMSRCIIMTWLRSIEENYVKQGKEFHTDFKKGYDEYTEDEIWDINLWSEGKFLGKYYWVANPIGKISSLAIYAYYDLYKESQRLSSIGHFGSISELKIKDISVDREGKNPYIDIWFETSEQPLPTIDI